MLSAKFAAIAQYMEYTSYHGKSYNTVEEFGMRQELFA